MSRPPCHQVPPQRPQGLTRSPRHGVDHPRPFCQSREKSWRSPSRHFCPRGRTGCRKILHENEFRNRFFVMEPLKSGVEKISKMRVAATLVTLALAMPKGRRLLLRGPFLLRSWRGAAGKMWTAEVATERGRSESSAHTLRTGNAPCRRRVSRR